MTDLFDVHDAEFVGVDCLIAGTEYCVVRVFFPSSATFKMCVMFVKDELFNLTRAWDKENI